MVTVEYDVGLVMMVINAGPSKIYRSSKQFILHASDLMVNIIEVW